MDVPAERVYDFDDLKKPGQFQFTTRVGMEGHTGMIFVCPCGCGSISGIPFRKKEGEPGPCWHWNGRADKPTLTPSIRKLDGCQWHGFLTDGNFQEC
ncbi:DUF6527 family protein [Candidatus Pacearchaeota archaeon]|jgi:hypothetical protein|nr:DUF6527 family protein [Candidatus Pacearchaeota archaeon]